MAPLFDALTRVAELVHENLRCGESIGGYARVDNVRNKTVEQLRQLHKAGCGNFYFGNESGETTRFSTA